MLALKKIFTFLLTFTLLFTVFNSVALADTSNNVIEQLKDEGRTALVNGAVTYDTFRVEENTHKSASTYAIGNYCFKEIENNDNFFSSNRIYHDQTIMGTTSSEDVDHYKFVLLEKNLVSFHVYSYSGNLSFGILDSDGNILLEQITSYDTKTGLGYGNIQINLNPGVYYFGILPLHKYAYGDIDYDLYYYSYSKPVLLEPYEDNIKNAQLLNNYINSFGYVNEVGTFLRNWFINSDENVVSSFIISNITDNTLIFDFYESESNLGVEAEIWFTYDIATGSADEISIALYDLNDDNHYFIASAPFEISKITPYTSLPFTCVDSEGSDTNPTPEQIKELGDYLLSEALYYWDAMLGLDLCFSLENLGFDSIYSTPSSKLAITKQP